MRLNCFPIRFSSHHHGAAAAVLSLKGARLMRRSNKTVGIAFIITLILSLNAFAQAGRGARGQSGGDKKAGTRTETPPAPQPKIEPTPPDEAQETEVVKVNTNLVTVPVVASDRSGLYVPDMRQEEFELAEDGVKQAVIFFATTKEP